MAHQRPGVGARLRRDMERAGVSGRDLGRRLAQRHGGDPESWRKYVSRWLQLDDGGHGLNVDNARMVAEELGTDHTRYLSTMYDELEVAKRRAERLAREAAEARAACG